MAEDGESLHRRSERGTKGKPPMRLGFEDAELSQSVDSTRTTRSSGKSTSTRYSAKRAVLEAERKLAEKDLELAKLAADEAQSERVSYRSTSPRLQQEVFDEADALPTESPASTPDPVTPATASQQQPVPVERSEHARSAAPSRETDSETDLDGYARTEIAGAPAPAIDRQRLSV
eukprot:scpid13258/ scgid11839/ 